jgi:hypothetical protein
MHWDSADHVLWYPYHTRIQLNCGNVTTTYQTAEERISCVSRGDSECVRKRPVAD